MHVWLKEERPNEHNGKYIIIIKIMTGNEYQTNVLGFDLKYPEGLGPFCTLLRMMEKIGMMSSTMVDILNKPDASITNKERDILRNELGEILMYLTRTIYHSGLTLDEVMQYNVDKQNNRQEYESIINRDMFKRR